MERQFLARPYKYADGQRYNSDRYEIFVRDKAGDEWVSVGGAIRSWNGRTVAFLCTPGVNRHIHTPDDAERMTDGFYVIGWNVKHALVTLKWKHPNPQAILREVREKAYAGF